MYQGITYTDPRLCDYGGDISKPWFVYFDITDHLTGITVRKQYRQGINYYSDKKNRYQAGQELVKFWKEKLKKGWTPFGNDDFSKLNRMTFSEALDFAIDKCHVARKTKSCYKGTAGFFKKAAVHFHLDKAHVACIERRHILLMLDKIRDERNWSNHACNKHVGYLSGIFKRLVKYEVIKYNPCHGISDLPVTETEKYKPITTEEKRTIKDYLIRVHPNYFTYLMVIYYTGIRPKEVLALRVKDVNLELGFIRIVPDLSEENSKTKTIRMVPINKNLSNLLTMHLQGANSMDFVFGSPATPGRGNTGLKGAMESCYFSPSKVMIKRDTVVTKDRKN